MSAKQNAMNVTCQKCKREFDPEDEGSAEIKGWSKDGEQVGPSVHYCLPCFGVEPEPEAAS